MSHMCLRVADRERNTDLGLISDPSRMIGDDLAWGWTETGKWQILLSIERGDCPFIGVSVCQCVNPTLKESEQRCAKPHDTMSDLQCHPISSRSLAGCCYVPGVSWMCPHSSSVARLGQPSVCCALVTLSIGGSSGGSHANQMADARSLLLVLIRLFLGGIL